MSSFTWLGVRWPGAEDRHPPATGHLTPHTSHLTPSLILPFGFTSGSPHYTLITGGHPEAKLWRNRKELRGKSGSFRRDGHCVRNGCCARDGLLRSEGRHNLKTRKPQNPKTLLSVQIRPIRSIRVPLKHQDHVDHGELSSIKKSNTSVQSACHLQDRVNPDFTLCLTIYALQDYRYKLNLYT